MSYMPSYLSMNVPGQAAAKFAETLIQVSPWDQNARVSGIYGHDTRTTLSWLGE